MRHGPIIFTILLLACGAKTGEIRTENDEETFDMFIDAFTTDSSFQMTRVKFPLEIVTWGIDDRQTIDKVASDNWRHLRFEYKTGYATRKIDAYTQEITISTDSASINLRGVDNGIRIDYVFKKVEGQWTLMIVRDYSN
jgi:hypothetical protein